MIIGFSDDGIVIVKPLADEYMVTYMRVKLEASNKDEGDEGRNMLAIMLKH